MAAPDVPDSVDDYQPPPLTAEEEDALLSARLTNDERPLRRVTRKFHAYSALANPRGLRGAQDTAAAIEEAREAFLVELASFQLLLNKSVLVCEAEQRQVDEYQKEKARIEQEQVLLRDQITELKGALEKEQLARRQKLEYDSLAIKVNAYPSRIELEQSISALEAEIASIESTIETEALQLVARKAAFDQIVADLSALRLMGKEPELEPPPDAEDGDHERERDESRVRRSRSPDSDAERELAAMKEPISTGSDDAPLNPHARPFHPRTTLLRGSSAAVTPATSPGPKHDEDGDIEMGEVAEPAKKAKPRTEELEEGEASDGALTPFTE